MKKNSDNLKEAIHIYSKKLHSAFPTEEEVANVKFSDEFEQKMNSIIRKRKRICYNMFNSSAKRVACFTAAFVVLLSVTLNVNAIRKPFVQMVRTVFNNHVEIEFQGDTKDFISEIYDLNYLPDGFEITNVVIDSNAVSREYTNKDGVILMYSQQATQHHSGIFIDNEHSTYHTLTVDEKEIYVVVSEWNITSAYWIDNGYSFSIHYYSLTDDEEISTIVRSNTIVGYQTE